MTEGPQVGGIEALLKDQKGGCVWKLKSQRLPGQGGMGESLTEMKGIYRYLSLGPKLWQGKAMVCDQKQGEWGEQSEQGSVAGDWGL